MILAKRCTYLVKSLTERKTSTFSQTLFRSVKSNPVKQRGELEPILFPCISNNNGAEPNYQTVVTGYKSVKLDKSFRFRLSGETIPEIVIAYETYGELNEKKDNAVLLQGGLSASSHARSHPDNKEPGWWEQFIGPGRSLDTDKFFVICSNNIGSCYGSTGPCSIDPRTNMPYATTFPIFTIEDMVESQMLLLESLGITKLHATVGSSLGGMLSLATAVLYPDKICKLVSISSCLKSHPSSIALRYLQRKAIMSDPNWQKGYYYDSPLYPKHGTKLAREIATLTYRSGPEWDERFGRKKIDKLAKPSLCPYFQIESYLDYQGEIFSTKLDPNSLLYISKAMDLFDLGETFGSMKLALERVRIPVMVIGVQTDILFPCWQQKELADGLQQAGNDAVSYYELNSLYGHDTFLLDLNGVGAGVKGFLETDCSEKGKAKKVRNDHSRDRITF